MSKSARREKDSMNKVTTMIATLESRNHGRESRLPLHVLKPTINRAVNQIETKSINKSIKKKLHMVYVSKPPIERKDSTCIPF